MNEPETQGSIVRWAKRTFGVASERQLIERAFEELCELWDVGLQDDQREEWADTYIVLCQLADRLGTVLPLSEQQQEEVDMKMAVNRKRSWRVWDTGVGQHE